MKTNKWAAVAIALLLIIILGCSSANEFNTGRTLQKRKYTAGWFFNPGKKVKADKHDTKPKREEAFLFEKELAYISSSSGSNDSTLINVQGGLTQSTLLEETDLVQVVHVERNIQRSTLTSLQVEEIKKGSKQKQTNQEPRHIQFSWLPLLYFLFALFIPPIVLNKRSKVFSVWARDHKKTSLLLLILAQFTLIGIALLLGHLLALPVSPWIALLGLLVFAISLLLNERSKSMGLAGYRTRLFASGSLSLAGGFSAFAMGSNGFLRNVDLFRNWSIGSGYTQVVEPTGELHSGVYTFLVIILIFIFVTLMILITVFSCVLICDGSAVAGILLFFGVGALITFAFIKLMSRLGKLHSNYLRNKANASARPSIESQTQAIQEEEVTKPEVTEDLTQEDKQPEKTKDGSGENRNIGLILIIVAAVILLVAALLLGGLSLA